MIELRWLVKDKDHFDVFKILQYRVTRQVSNFENESISFTTVWAEWKDVPVVEDEDDRT